jgi:hypothetical protein
MVDLPLLDDFFDFLDSCEPFLVQASLAIPPVEALDAGVLGGFAGVGELELDAVVICPSIKPPFVRVGGAISPTPTVLNNFATGGRSCSPEILDKLSY